MSNKYIEEFDKLNIEYKINEKDYGSQLWNIVKSDFRDWFIKTLQSAKKEAVEKFIEKIDAYEDKLIREGAEKQSDYYMGEISATSEIKELLK
ncbi:MAG: hypothetical protein H6743_03860 [Rickettsiaceae bacterium]|nr:hypothetical protein [Rickettsiaceae bacterium]